MKEAQEKLSEEEFKEIAEDVLAELLLEELAKKLLTAINEGKKVYKVTGYSAYNQDGWGNTTSYSIR